MADERRFARLDQLFQAALARPPEERRQWLAAQDDDPALLDEVRELLEEDAAGEPLDLENIVDAGWQSVMRTPEPAVTEAPATEAPATEAATEVAPIEPTTVPFHAAPEATDHPGDPVRVGPYRILGRLGRGGMATVYLAEHAGEFSMQVALKRIRRGMDTDDILERLRLERRILARLVHPNIGRIHDGGSDEQGRPYLVMEVIEGERIDHWCAARRLPVRRRLGLFLQACEAVSFAHQKLILHRDLKPSNILVTDDGTVKLLDFGIAKVLAGDPAAGSQPTVTDVEQRLLTPDYASPEQLLGLPLTTTSDVYSLGVVLYLLISGRLPHAGGDNLSAFRRLAGEHQNPTSASRAARQQHAAGNPLAGSDRWLATAGGELDAVTGKALETAPARRYSSVRELAEDVERLLDDRPILARRPSLGYRLVKLVRRHRLGVTLGALVALSLLAAVIGTSWQAAVASRERQRAQRQQGQAEAVADFLVDLFEVSDPYSEARLADNLGDLTRPRGETVTARELLDAAARRVGEGLGGDWSRRSRLRRAIARAYFNLSLYDRARRQLEAAAGELAAVDEGSGDAAELEIARASVAGDLGWLEARQGHFDAAEDRLRAAERQLAAVGDAARGEFAATLEHFGELELLRGDSSAAEERYDAALEHYRELYGERSLAVARARAGLARVLGLNGRAADVAALLRQILVVRGELLGDQHPLVLETLNDLAVASRDATDYTAAERIFEDLLSRQRLALGSEHADLAATLYNSAAALASLGRPAEAEARLTEAWRLAERHWAQTPLAAKILMLRGLLRERQQEIEGAAALYQQALALRRRLFGTGHAETVTALLRLGLLWAKAGDRRAEPLLHEALEVSARLELGEEAPAYLALGELALATDRPLVAERRLRHGLHAVGDRGGWLAGILELRLARAYQGLGKHAEALAAARRARELLATNLGAKHSWTVEAETLSRQLAPQSAFGGGQMAHSG